MSNIFKSIIFGIIEGITEWLPVSSTGHLIIAEKFISFRNVSPGFYETYSVVIQLGAVLCVFVLFYKELFPFYKDNKRLCFDNNKIDLWIKIVIACIPAAIIGTLLNDFIEKQLFNYKIVAYALIIYGFLFIITEYRNKNKSPAFSSASEIDLKTAFFIGLFQSLSLIPGTSRSGATILGGIVCGASRQAAAQFSFFMALPVMLGASLVKLFKFGLDFSAEEINVLCTGFITSFAVSMLTIKELMNFVKRHTFISFGYYRIILGICVLLFFTFYR
ncbi:MAG: undecaprenyl-diphosphate phosphatase [Clostridia bacterium]|nr:undecaprenyl-diphosphate phosphatase [Clostridia bacterium]